MVIYSHKKEFIGMEEKDLKALKLSSLAELRSEAADFADLFVKTPGYIHNFKHVHWIDFVNSSDSIDENRVIISVKGKNYRATIELIRLYLVEDPAQEAYGVVLQGIRELTKEENQRISGDLTQRPMPNTVEVNTPPQPTQTAVEEPQPVVQDPYMKDELDLEIPTPAQSEPQPQEEQPIALDLGDDLLEDVIQPQEEKNNDDVALDLGDELFLDEDVQTKTEQEEVVTEAITQPKITQELLDEDEFKDYRYDPEVASSELGLPIDLVEEFIQDFIAQAEEFRPELYQALDQGKTDVLRMTSHKLKGVAANLRIEDAYDALVTINTSDNMDKVKRTLDRFYLIILKKLAGEEIASVSESEPEQTPKEQELPQEDELSLDIKEDEISLDIEDEPLEIEDEPLDIKLEDEIELDVEDEPLDIKLEDDENIEDELLELDLKQDDVEKEPVEIELNKPQVIAEMGITQKVYDELFRDFVTDLSGGLEQLKQCIAQNDEECVQKLSLRLKGMSDNMRITQISENLEKLLKQDGKREDIVLKIVQQLHVIERMA